MPTPCTRCNSDQTFSRPLLDAYGDTGVFTRPAKVSVDRNPDAWIFKDTIFGELIADICGVCGHVDLRVKNFDELYQNYLNSPPQHGE